MRTVIFDLDGTLADTSGDLIDAANGCFRQMGAGDLLCPSGDAATAMHGARAMLRLGLSRIGRAGDEAEVERQYPVFLDLYEAQLTRHSHLYDGAEQVVEDLKSAGYRVGVCTNKPARMARVLLIHFGVFEAFGALVGADTLPVRKPDPEPLRETVRRAGGDPAQSLLVGDTITDRKTASAAGVPTSSPSATRGVPMRSNNARSENSDRSPDQLRGWERRNEEAGVC